MKFKLNTLYTKRKCSGEQIDTLKDTILRGNFNVVQSATNCKFLGKHNHITYAEDCEVEGDHNTVINYKDCTMKGNRNLQVNKL